MNQKTKKEIFDFIMANPTADITIHCIDGKSYGLVCLTLFNFAVKLPQQIIIGEYDSNNTTCININSNPDNIDVAVSRLFELIGNNKIKELFMNE